MVWLLAFSPSPPASFVVPVFIRHRPGPLGTSLTGVLPPSLGPWPHVSAFHITFARHFAYRGALHSYLRASCPVPPRFTGGLLPFARARYFFNAAPTDHDHGRAQLPRPLSTPAAPNAWIGSTGDRLGAQPTAARTQGGSRRAPAQFVHEECRACKRPERSQHGGADLAALPEPGGGLRQVVAAHRRQNQLVPLGVGELRDPRAGASGDRGNSLSGRLR